jgi:16S rRNA (adenine1518-N6/adenine1519-N6)-dimethyltransferase
MENLTDIKVIKEILSRHGFSFSKNLGQNFLINPTVCPRIAELGGAKAGVGAIEIGTGVGVLTHELAKRADKVVAIEIDSRLIPVLNETLAEHDNVTVINDDIMKIDLQSVIKEHFDGMDVVVCANLPYYITSPIIMNLLESRLPLKSITVMVQKEAGVRLCAEMGTRDAGAVTAAVRYYAEPELLFNVSRGSFMPSPNVDSCVIRLTLHDNKYQACDEAFFFKTVRGAFNQRRKNLLNSLSSAFGTDKSTIEKAALAAGISPASRPEQLSMDDFIRLSDELKIALDPAKK